MTRDSSHGPKRGESFDAYCERLKAWCREIGAAESGVGRFTAMSQPDPSERQAGRTIDSRPEVE